MDSNVPATQYVKLLEKKKQHQSEWLFGVGLGASLSVIGVMCLALALAGIISPNSIHTIAGLPAWMTILINLGLAAGCFCCIRSFDHSQYHKEQMERYDFLAQLALLDPIQAQAVIALVAFSARVEHLEHQVQAANGAPASA